jgi:hypothetical protein
VIVADPANARAAGAAGAVQAVVALLLRPAAASDGLLTEACAALGNLAAGEYKCEYKQCVDLYKIDASI